MSYSYRWAMKTSNVKYELEHVVKLYIFVHGMFSIIRDVSRISELHMRYTKKLFYKFSKICRKTIKEISLLMFSCEFCDILENRFYA